MTRVPKAKISEIFYSFQGEGLFTGVPQVFVRFLDCNLKCVWCDTPQSEGKTSFEFLSVDQVHNMVDRLWDNSHSISLTGGEPLLESDFLKVFLPRLKENKRKTFLETNGTCPRALIELIQYIDIVSMDMKLPSSTLQPAFWKAHEEFLSIARQREVYVKVVVTNETTSSDIHKAADIIAGIDSKIPLVIQPNHNEIGSLLAKKCETYKVFCLDYLENVSVKPQQHKILKIR